MAKAKAPARRAPSKSKTRKPKGGRQLRRQGHHRPRGPGGRPQAPRDVHRLDRRARPAPPRLRGRRQLRRRGDRRPLPTTSRSPCIPTTRAPSSTTAAGSRSTCTRRRSAGRRGRADRRCTPAASSATAAATRSPAGCTASASRSSTRSPSGSTSRSAATATSGPRTTRAASRHREFKKGAAAKETGTKITFLPDLEIFEEIGVRLRDARRAPARDRLPDPRPEDRPDRRARRRARRSTSTTRAGSSTSSPT